MRDIVSPLDGFRSPFGQRFRDAYAVAGFKPALVFDFANEYYRTGGSRTTFDSAMTHSRSGNATMVDSDGLLKWAPHNLALNSATPATQNITVISGADYTIECTGVSIALSGAGSGTVTEGNPVTITASTTTLTLTVTGSTGTMWAYRSDLGGMVNNPNRSPADSYVPTTSAAIYMPRRNSYVYNGAEWVNEGLLVESEARTNVVTYSEDFSNAFWPKSDVSVAASSVTDPAGGTGAYELIESATTANHLLNKAGLVGVTTATYTNTIFAKANTRSWIRVQNQSPSSSWVNVNLTNGEIGLTGGGEDTYSVTNFGNGWYRISLTSTQVSQGNGPQIFVLDGDKGGPSPSYTGDGTSSILIYGAQFEQGSVPSSYIPTSGSTVTRAADTLTVPSANLPWPTPNVIGPELVTNGTFDTDVSGWTADATYGGTLTHDTTVFAGGGLKITHTASYSGAYQAITTTVGKTYVVTASFDKDGVTQTCTLEATTTTTFNSGRLAFQSDGTNATGSLSVTFVATGTTTYIHMNGDSNASRVHYWDNISVREIDPLAVSIQMQGRATGNTYTTTRWYLDANNYITQEINSSDFTFEQANAGTVDAVTGGSFTSGVNTSFNFASTHASTLVAAAVGGTALTDNTTPTALADLSSTDMALAYSGGPMILKKVRMWPANITEAGREEASA